MICCFTGHRGIEEDVRAKLTAALDRRIGELYKSGVREFRAGGAIGFDMLAAGRVLFFRESHPDAKLSLILPCRNQTEHFTQADRAVWERQIASADSVRFISEVYTTSCMHERNRALVNGSDVCVAYLRENRGGTLYTCAYALKNNLRFINLFDDL